MGQLTDGPNTQGSLFKSNIDAYGVETHKVPKPPTPAKKDGKPTQNDMILAHMQAGHTLTPMDALNLFGCFRLAARIYELRLAGHVIDATTLEVGQGRTVAQYSMRPTGELP